MRTPWQPRGAFMPAVAACVTTLLLWQLNGAAAGCSNSSDSCAGPMAFADCVASWCPALTSIKVTASPDLYGTVPATVGSFGPSLRGRFELVSMPLLTGTLPAAVGSLTALLHKFILDSVGLTGTLPRSLGSLRNLLGAFVLENVAFSGTLPASLLSLSNLHSAFVLESMPLLEGSLPDALGLSLRQLQEYFVVTDMPLLTGTLPPSLGSATGLTKSFAMENVPGLTGTLPPSLGSLGALVSGFEVEDCAGLTGTLPPSLGSLSSLRSLFVLRGLGLTGTIPPSLSSLSAGELFALQDMPLSGTIPSALGSLKHMSTGFALEGLDLTGTVPPSIGSLTDMRSAFALDFLELSGTLPTSLGQISELAYQLWIQGTQLTGSLPYQLHQMTSLAGMYISGNAFSGEVNLPCSTNRFGQPIEMGLVQLDLSNNLLTEIEVGPDRHADLCLNTQIITLLNFSHNPLGGTVPVGLGSFTSLESLDMSNCDLTGTLPASVASLTLLRALDLSRNRMQPLLPPGLCHLEVDNFSLCNLSAQVTDASSRYEEEGWDCRLLSFPCAQRLATYCEVGPLCLDTCSGGLCKPAELVWPLVAAGSTVVVIAAVVLVHLFNKRVRKKRISEHRQNMTMMLLKDYVAVDELARVLLPTGSVDFSAASPCVAAGAAGRVYKCTAVSQINARLRLKQTVALKEIYAMEMIGDKVAITEFAKELTVLMKLQHENIVNFLGVYFHADMRDGVALNRYFMVTQFAERGSLDVHIQKDFAGVSLARRQTWVREIALALRYLHRENFVHRDIKPNNVLMSADWHCLLADFGIARSSEAQQTVDNLTTKIGTVQFMPPEALNNVVGPASLVHAKAWDSYSFAILVAVVFMRQRVPYPGINNRAVMVQILVHHLRPTPPPVLSPEYTELLAALWSEEPSARPDFTAILDRLDALKGHEFSALGQAYLSSAVATGTEDGGLAAELGGDPDAAASAASGAGAGGAAGPGGDGGGDAGRGLGHGGAVAARALAAARDDGSMDSLDSLSAVGDRTRRPKPRARTVGVDDLRVARAFATGSDLHV